MKKVNRIITAALAMACLMLCACGSKAEGSTVTAGQTQKSAAAMEEAAAPAAEESGAAETVKCLPLHYNRDMMFCICFE